jgi:hydrogenase/urease accessory protein HupE
MLKFLAAFSLLLGVTLSSPGQASAHAFEYGTIKTNLTVQNETIQLSSDVSQKITADAATAADQINQFQQYFSQNLSISNQDKACTFKLNTFDHPAENQTIFNGAYTCQTPARNLNELKIRTTLFADFFTNFNHFVNVGVETQKKEIVFSPTKKDYPSDFNIKAHETSQSAEKIEKPNFFSNTRQFILSGMQHIWQGYDHLLFLLSAVLLIQTVKKFLIVATSFTVAHSITLILAGLDIIKISPDIVEPIIAMSIALLALRNTWLIRRGQTNETSIREIVVLTSAFGLVHGLGFAGALSEAHIPKEYLVSSLLFFNVGVELGQIFVLLGLIPLLLWIHELKGRNRILTLISLVTIILSGFWFIERTLLS